MKKVEDAKVEKITAEELEKLQGFVQGMNQAQLNIGGCLLYTSPSPRD